jgi:hypothetical protein
MDFLAHHHHARIVIVGHAQVCRAVGIVTSVYATTADPKRMTNLLL